MTDMTGPKFLYPPWGLQPCSSCFVGFLVLFFGIGWDARGETLCNKQSFCTQASYLSRVQYYHKKGGIIYLCSRNAAIFICRRHYFSRSVVFFQRLSINSSNLQYFLKRRRILSKHGGYLRKMQYSWNEK